MTCNQGHGEISYQARKCPLCQGLQENQKLRRLLEDLQLQVLVKEAAELFNFDSENGNSFEVGQA
jgi:hypothetical protein